MVVIIFVFFQHNSDKLASDTNSLTTCFRDYDTYSTNDEIGKCQVAISDIPENEKKEMWLSVESEEKIQQEKLKDQKNAIGGRKRDRVFQNIVMSGAPPSTKKTELFVRIHWRRWDEQEQDIINEAVRVGAWRMLESKKGASCSRELRKLLLSGTVSITVKKCRGLQVHGILQRPSIKAVVKVADMEPAESPSLKVTRRGNADLSGTPVQVDVEGHTVENDSNDIFIKLQEVGFMSGNDVVGVLRFNLRKLVDQRFISGKFQLQDPNKADIKFSDSMPNSSVEESVANVDVKWVGTFS